MAKFFVKFLKKEVSIGILEVEADSAQALRERLGAWAGAMAEECDWYRMNLDDEIYAEHITDEAGESYST